MCFSATASFTAGVVLTGIGVATLRKVEHPRHILFASIPLLFAFQQFSEGMLWLTIPLENVNATTTKNFFTNVFLFFAQVIWPFLVPLSVMLLEKQRSHKNIQSIFVGIGSVVSVYLFYCLLYFPVKASIVGYHCAYQQDYPVVLREAGGFLYIIATIAPLFFSHVRNMWLLGLTILLSYLVTALFYEHYVLSVWCFFASVISISVYLIMVGIRNSHLRISANEEPIYHSLLIKK
jgi:hypothetical protein